jgi:pimeloyl-ACP methyl ester carboxylesterase
MSVTRLLSRALLALLLTFFALLGAVAIIGVLQRPNLQIPPGFIGDHIDVKGIPTRVVQRGAGRDVLLIHGSPGSIEDWAPLLDSLKGEFRVTAYDRPGHGYSGDAGAYSLDYNAEFASALIEALKLTHLVVVGHSYGGATALNMATRSAPNVDAYVIVDSASYQPSRAPDPIYHLLAIPGLGMGFASMLSASIAPSKIRAGLQRVFRDRAPPEAFVDLRARIWSSPKVSHAAAIETLGAAEALEAQSARYPSIQKPVHILAEADDKFRIREAEHLYRDISGSSLELLADSGHYLQFEKPAEVVAAVRKVALQPAP